MVIANNIMIARTLDPVLAFFVGLLIFTHHSNYNIILKKMEYLFKN